MNTPPRIIYFFIFPILVSLLRILNLLLYTPDGGVSRSSSFSSYVKLPFPRKRARSAEIYSIAESTHSLLSSMSQKDWED
jgi:hypothetical protein